MPPSYPTRNPLHPAELKKKQRGIRSDFPPPLSLRVHRSLSWLLRAEQEVEDDDVRFILLWVGFNAAYAGDVDQAGLGSGETERGLFQSFFTTLVELDGKHRIYDAVWQRFSQEIRVLLENPFVFAPFWQHHNGFAGNDDWKEKLHRSRIALGHSLRQHDTARILSIVFDRLYILRNQLVHGGSTWNSSVNRNQVRDGAAIIGFMLPIFVDLMMDNPSHNWPMPHYPVVEIE
jgi:hypothetical protein